jgi:hypothetical protein
MPTVPAAPTGLVATSQNGSVYLTWVAPANGGSAITDYVVQQKLSSQLDTSFVVVPDGIKSTPGATITCTNGTAYVFRVAAKNAIGTGPYCSNSLPVTPSTIPSQPSAPTCISGNGQVTINWLAPANGGSAITDYAIQRKINGQADTTYANLADGVSATTSYTNTGLTNGVSYVYRVAAINSKGASLWSAGSAPVVPSAAPNAPTNLVATSGNGVVNLSWTAPANNGAIITDYTIQRRLSSETDSSFVQVIDTVSSATTASIASINGTSYVFKVAAINAKGIGAYSANSSAVTPSTVPSQCSAPICSKGFNQVTLNWSAPDNGGSTITDYVVQRKVSGQADTSYVTIPHSASNSTTLISTGLVNDTSYVFRVAAVNAKGQGLFSAGSQPAIPGVLPPGAPTNLVATIVYDTGVSFNWTPPTDNGGENATSYTIQSKPQSGSSWKTITSNYAYGVSLAITGHDDVPTVFRVAGVNSAGVGTYSAESNSVTPSNKLFDKSSWRGIVAEPYFTYLNKAADRWYKYIKYNSTNRATLASENASYYSGGWNGLRLEDSSYYGFYSDSTSGVIASSGPIYARSFGGKKYNSISFQLNINDYHRTKTNPLTENNWIDALTHELGHALGIGIFWDHSIVSGATSPINFFLDGTVYTQAQAAYNSISSQTRSKVPLENTGGSGTANSHWENNFRPASAAGSLGVSYPGLSNELMVGYITDSMVLSSLTVKTLVDFGWEQSGKEIAENEGNPTLVSSISAFASIDNILGKCEGPKTKVVLRGESLEGTKNVETEVEGA